MSIICAAAFHFTGCAASCAIIPGCAVPGGSRWRKAFAAFDWRCGTNRSRGSFRSVKLVLHIHGKAAEKSGMPQDPQTAYFEAPLEMTLGRTYVGCATLSLSRIN